MSSDSDSLDNFSEILNHSSGQKLVKFIRKKRGNPFTNKKLIVLPALEGIDVNIDFVRLGGNVDSINIKKKSNDSEERVLAGTSQNNLHKNSNQRRSTNLKQRTLLKEFEKTLESPFFPPSCSTPVARVSSKSPNVLIRKDSTSTSAVGRRSSLTESVIIISDTEESNAGPDKIIEEIKQELQPLSESKSKGTGRRTYTIENSHTIHKDRQPNEQASILPPNRSPILAQRSQAEAEPCGDRTQINVSRNSGTDLPAALLENIDIKTESPEEILRPEPFIGCIVNPSESNNADVNSVPLFPNSDRRGNNSCGVPLNPLLPSTHSSLIDHDYSDSRTEIANPVLQSKNYSGGNNSRRRIQSPVLESPKNDHENDDYRGRTQNSVHQSSGNYRGGNNPRRRNQSPELESPKNDKGNDDYRGRTQNSVLQSSENYRGGNNSSRRIQSSELASAKNDHQNKNNRERTSNLDLQLSRNDCEENSSKRIQSPGMASPKNDHENDDYRGRTQNSVHQSSGNYRGGNNPRRRNQSPELESPKNDKGNDDYRGRTQNSVLQSSENYRGGNNSSRRIQSSELASAKNDHQNNNNRERTSNLDLQLSRNDCEENSSKRIQSPEMALPKNDQGNDDYRGRTQNSVLQSSGNYGEGNNPRRRIHSPELESPNNDQRNDDYRGGTRNSVLQSSGNYRGGNNPRRRIQSPELESPKNDQRNDDYRGGTQNSVLQSSGNNRGGNNSSRRIQSPELASPKNNYRNKSSIGSRNLKRRLTKNVCGDNNNSTRETDYMVSHPEQSEGNSGSTKNYTAKKTMSKNYLMRSKDQNQHTSHRFPLARMSTGEILDLRTRNSEGKVFVTRGPLQNKSILEKTTCLEEDISRELLLRTLKPESRNQTNFLSPPDEFKDNTRSRITRLSKSVRNGVPPSPISPRQSSLIDDDSGDRITFSQKTMLTNGREIRKKGKDKKPKVPELVKQYLELSESKKKSKEFNDNSKRRLYSKGMSENSNSSSDSEGIRSFNSDRKNNKSTSSHSTTNNVIQENLITESRNDERENNVPHSVHTEEICNASTSSSVGSQTSSACAKNADGFSSKKTQKDSEVFKRPKTPVKRRLTSKKKISKLPKTAPAPSENSESSETSENTTGCRRSKRGHKPLKCYWSFTQTEYIPLWDIRILELRKKEKEKANKKSTKSDNSHVQTAERLPLASSTANSFGLNKDTIDANIQSSSGDVNTNVGRKRKYKEKSKRLTTIAEKKSKIGNTMDETSSCDPKYSVPSDRQLTDDCCPSIAGQSPDPINIPCENSTIPIQRNSSAENKNVRVLLPRLNLVNFTKKSGSSDSNVIHQNTDSGCCTANQLSTALPSATSPVQNPYDLLHWLKTLSNIEPADLLQNNPIPDHFSSEYFDCARFSNVGCTKIGGIEYKFYKHEEALLLGYMNFEPKAGKNRVKLVKFDLVLLVLFGKLEFEIDGQTGTVGSGDLLSIKKGTYYSLHNRHERLPALAFVVKK